MVLFDGVYSLTDCQFPTSSSTHIISPYWGKTSRLHICHIQNQFSGPSVSWNFCVGCDDAYQPGSRIEPWHRHLGPSSPLQAQMCSLPPEGTTRGAVPLRMPFKCYVQLQILPVTSSFDMNGIWIMRRYFQITKRMLSPFIIKSSPLRNDSHMCHDKYSPVGAPHRDHFGLALWDGCAEWEELVPSLKRGKGQLYFFKDHLPPPTGGSSSRDPEH